MSDRCRHKGRFIKKKVRDALLRRSENAKNLNNITFAKKAIESDEPRSANIEGTRLVDMKHMSEQIFCTACKTPLLMQDIERETKQGVGVTFHVRCANCLLMNMVKNSKEYKNPTTDKLMFVANTKVALGAVHSGIGETQINKFLNTLDVPGINTQLFKKHERVIGPLIEYVAKESCSEAAEMERALTLENIEELKKLLPTDLQEQFLIVNVDSSDSERPLVRIFTSYDMGWSQRGNGHTYDSLNGYCAIIGFKTGKVLDYCTKNRKCKICESELRTGKNIEHDCRLNFHGSAKAMESDGAVELVKNSIILEQANLQVGVFIGDNDSSCISAIQNVSDHPILKQSDMNHSVKGIGNILHEIHKDKAADPEKELTNEIIKHIQRCFSYAIYQNKGKIEKIKVAIENILYHLFDHHENCGSWCNSDDKENISGIRLSNIQLFETLKKIFIQLANSGEKFVSAASSQANESLNNSMCSKAPKRICYSTSESADFRFAATIGQKNCGVNYLRRTMDIANIPWSKNLDTYVDQSDKKLLTRKEKNKQSEAKKRRLELKAKRSQLRNQKERNEGNTYQSNMSLLDTHVVHEDQCLQILTSDTTSYETDEFTIVFFDLETAGLKLTHEILQVSMKCGKYTFTSFITPTRTIAPATTKANGLSTVHKKLFQHGHEVFTRPLIVVLKKILEYLKNLGKKCILVAHNCAFDSTRLIRAHKKFSLFEELEEAVVGFSDTLALFKKTLPKRKNGYKLTTLATELLNLPCDGAHDARFDTNLLEKLTVSYILIDEIINSRKSAAQIAIDMQNVDNTKKVISSYTFLNSILSISMQRKLATFGITQEMLTETFKIKGIERTESLLKGEINGKPQIIKSKKILKKILDYLEKY